jgi:hypothetical protein
MSADDKTIEEATDELYRVCDEINWEVDAVIEQDLGSSILLEANVRFTIKK